VQTPVAELRVHGDGMRAAFAPTDPRNTPTTDLPGCHENSWP
jgi:hypothetical protein